MTGANGFSSIYIWSAKDGKLRKVTDELFNAENPAWDPDGNYLFYLSDRDYAPQISTAEFNYATNRTTGIFALALRKDVKHPFPPESDEVTVKEEKPAAAQTAKPTGWRDAPAAEAADRASRPTISPSTSTASRQRVARVPVEADNYGGLSGQEGPSALRGRARRSTTAAQPDTQGRRCDIYSLKDRKETTLVDDVGGYALSADGSKVLAASRRDRSRCYDATPAGAGAKKTVSTAGLMVDRVPAEEWNQIFNEVWRRYRDCFYVENMHGYDWEALRKQYAPLLHVRRPPLRPQLRDQRDDLGADRAARLHRRRRLRDPAAAAGGAAGRALRARPGGGPLPDREDLQRRRTRSQSTARRSPRSASTSREGDYVLAIDGDELQPDDDPVPPAAQQGRPPGAADRELASRRSTARARSPSARSPTRAT